MITNRTAWRRLLGALLIAASPHLHANAQEVQVPSNFVTSQINANGGGGLTHYADGDILTITSNFVSGPALVRHDTNGDGVPGNNSLTLASFDVTSFGNFVQMAPSGIFALAGFSGSDNSVYRIEAATHAVTKAFSADGSYDLVFVDDTKAYLSSSPGGFDPAAPNAIDLVDLSAPAPVLTRLVEVFGTPSGAIALNASGDLYYIKSTFVFPAPPGSHRLLRFSAAKLEQARVTGSPLVEGDSDIDVTLPGGYDIVFHRLENGGELFITTIGDTIYRINEATLSLEPFLTVNDPTFPALTFISMRNPATTFEPFKPSQAELMVSLTTEFFSKFSVIRVRPDTFDSDGDNFIDAVDECPADAAKLKPGTCGCGAPEADTNADGIADCGSQTVFDQALAPRFGVLSGGTGTVSMLLETVQGSSVRYEVELRGPNSSRLKKKTSKVNGVTFTRLKPGLYQARFRVTSKSGRRTVRSSFSQTLLVQVS